MAELKTRSRADELEAAFKRRAQANGRTFAQEVEFVLQRREEFMPEEGGGRFAIFSCAVQRRSALADSR
jgi:hypothetical protein